MKRILVILILISYSVASFGVSLNYFYCCGVLKGVSLRVNTEEKIWKTKTGKGCCDNKTVTLKLKVDQKNTEQTSFKIDNSLSPAILQTHDCEVIYIATSGNINSLYKRPPPPYLPSRNILFCVFRI